MSSSVSTVGKLWCLSIHVRVTDVDEYALYIVRPSSSVPMSCNPMFVFLEMPFPDLNELEAESNFVGKNQLSKCSHIF